MVRAVVVAAGAELDVLVADAVAAGVPPVALTAAEERAAAAEVAEAAGTVGAAPMTALGLLNTWSSLRPTLSVESETPNTPK